MYHLYHLHVHVRDSRKSVERDTVDASSACLCDVHINARVVFLVMKRTFFTHEALEVLC